ncbi:MAG: DUF924 family protein [Pseudomonadota bacterium]
MSPDQASYEAVVTFWVKETGPDGWYASEPALDATIRERFEDQVIAARSGKLDCWTCKSAGTLALLILLDQFPRNIYRDDHRAFASDAKALSVAKQAIARGHDLHVAEPERQFFYLPLMHAECLPDQDRCVRLIATRMPATGADNMVHARAHREVIRRFGRFPHRNAALKRATTPAEEAFLTAGGYGGVVRALQAA